MLEVHSGTLGMYMPWAYDSQHLAKRNRGPMLSVLEDTRGVDQQGISATYRVAGVFGPRSQLQMSNFYSF